jgi:hypothetical protein
MTKPGFWLEFLNRGNMAFGEIHHVDVVPDARAIHRLVVIAIDPKNGSLPIATWVIYGMRLFGMPFGSSPK